MCLGEARRTRRGLANRCPFIDPLKRRDECRESYDYDRDSEEYESGTVAILLVAHERLPLSLFIATATANYLVDLRLRLFLNPCFTAGTTGVDRPSNS